MIVVLVKTLVLVSVVHGWRESVSRPRAAVRDYLQNTGGDLLTFVGNQTHSDHFKLLKQDGHSLLIGARNNVYNLSLTDLRENTDQRIVWNSRERDRELCKVKGKSEDECNNYIRVLARVEEDELLVCGTNSYNPRCRNYVRNNQSVYEVIKEFSGKGYCPYDPTHNSTSIFADGELYSGTVSDFSGSDSLIIKNEIRTGQYNLQELNGPDFVSSIEDKDFVYFFFREEAVEYMNCGKAVYSRVARVCKKDAGGPRAFRNKWTSFVKARLNCSMPGAYPFYFDQVQAMSQVVDTATGDKIIFGVFNTPENAISGSAVCSFRMSEIVDSFNGPFKGQADSNTNWLPVAKHEEPDTRPGSCHNDSRSLDEKYLNFVKKHALMDQAVDASTKEPHFIRTSPHEKLTTISVDPAVSLVNGVSTDVLFIGTTTGRVIKIASFIDEEGEARTSVIEEMQVFPPHISVNNILVVRSEDQEPRLVVLSDHEVKSIPVQRCRDHSDCGACVGLQDPYCAWNIQERLCDTHLGSQVDASSLLQNIVSGQHPVCGTTSSYDYSVSSEQFAGSIADSNSRSLRNEFNAASAQNYFDNAPVHSMSTPLEGPFVKSNHERKDYSEQTLSVACASSAFISLLLGFLIGHLFTKKCSNKEMKCGHANLEALMLERSKDPNSIYESPYTLHTPSMTTKNNLLSNHPVKSDTQKNNLTTVNANNGTLGKCKKVYI